MTQVEITDEAYRRIAAAADQRGVSVSTIIAGLAGQLPGPGRPDDRPVPAFVAAGASERGITNRMNDLVAGTDES
jgi:hypothetical protein